MNAIYAPVQHLFLHCGRSSVFEHCVISFVSVSLFWVRGCDKFAVRVQREMQNVVVGRRSVGASRFAIACASASSSHSASSTSTSSSVYSATILPALAFWLLLQSPTLLKSPTPLLIYQTPRFKFWAAASSAGRGGQPFRSERGEARSFFSSQPRFFQPVVFSGRPSPFLASFAATS